MLEKLEQINFTIIKSHADELLDLIWKLNCVHLAKVDHIELSPLEIPSHDIHHYTELLDDFNQLEIFFNFYSNNIKQPNSVKQCNDNNKCEELLKNLRFDISKWKKEIAEIEEKKLIFKQYEHLLAQFQDYIPVIPEKSLLEVRGIILQDVTQELIDALKSRLRVKTNDLFDLDLHGVSSKFMIGSLVYPKEYADAITQILVNSRFSELTLPGSVDGNSLAEKIDGMMSDYQLLHQREKVLFQRLQSFYSKYLRLARYRTYLEQELSKIEGFNYLMESDELVFLSGFISPNSRCTIEDTLQAHFEDGTYYISTNTSPSYTPAKMKNYHGIEEFEIFTGILPPLAGNSIDPTILISIFFPLFYGFIVGDIGYGIIISLIGLIVYQKTRYNVDNDSMRRLSWVIMVSGIWTIIFGILFGEFLGNLGTALGLHPVLFHRSERLMDLLFISIGIGVIHVILGLSIGVYNAYLVNHSKVVFGNLGLILCYSAIFVYATTTLSGVISGVSIIPTLGLGIIGIFLLLKGEGFIGIIEILSTIGNMLSYARLMALGAASVILADLANEMYHIAGGGIPGILATILIHMLNIVIALFSPTIHSMRLHLVEFFNKFVEYGDQKFNPYGSNSTVTVTR